MALCNTWAIALVQPLVPPLGRRQEVVPTGVDGAQYQLGSTSPSAGNALQDFQKEQWFLWLAARTDATGSPDLPGRTWEAAQVARLWQPIHMRTKSDHEAILSASISYTESVTDCFPIGKLVVHNGEYV